MGPSVVSVECATGATFLSSRPSGGVFLWVADPRQVTFLCAAKEKSPKERPPRMAQPNPALLGLWGPRRSYEASCLEDQARTSCPRPLRGALPKPCGARVCAI